MKKSELISNLSSGRRTFLENLEDIPQGEMTTPGVIEDWSIKDVLVHLTRWEAELVKLLWQANQGQSPTTVHFSPESVDEVNQRWYQQSLSRSMQVVWDDFLKVRQQTIRRIEAFSEPALNDPGLYAWLDGKALWEWVAVDSFEHEAEHLNDILRWKRSEGNTR